MRSKAMTDRAPTVITAVFLLLALATAATCKHLPNVEEMTPQQLLEHMNNEYWQSATAYRRFADDTLSPEILMREKLRPYYAAMEKFDWRNFSDPLMRRQFEIILRGAKYPPVDQKFKKATHTLKNMSRQKWTCQREHPGKCNMAFVHQIKSIFTNSDDLENIQYYWQEWRNKMPVDVKDALHFYVGYYQNLSTPEMTPSAVWYEAYEDPEFTSELEDLMETIGPFYREMHAHFRHLLRQNYGNDVIPPTGLIPHHLMEQVTYQAWKKDSVLSNPFPERRLPNLQAEMDEDGFTPSHLINVSAQYFGSLGFRNLSESFMRDHIIPMEAGTGGPDCKSRIFDFGEVELNYCPKVYYKKLLQTHGDMTLIQYALAKNNYSVGLNQEACPGFGNAMAEAVILSVSNPQHLQKRLSLLEDYDYDDLLNLNRLYRLAVHTMLTVPTYFVHEKLWVDMIEGRVVPANYSCHYWNLMQKYMGVDAPAKTDARVYDMPYKFYEGIIEQYRGTKKLFGEFLGYQIYRAICMDIGEFVRGNAYKTLDNCDFAGKRDAGSLLKDMMSIGSMKPWREIIKPLTKRRLNRLTATAFLEYFDSLHHWVADDNVSKKLHVGWMVSDKCQSTQYKTPNLPADTEDQPY